MARLESGSPRPDRTPAQISRRRALGLLGGVATLAAVPRLNSEPESQTPQIQRVAETTLMQQPEPTPEPSPEETAAGVAKTEAEADKLRAEAEQIREQIRRDNEQSTVTIEDARRDSAREDDGVANFGRIAQGAALITAVGGIVGGGIKFIYDKRETAKTQAQLETEELNEEKAKRLEARQKEKELRDEAFAATSKGILSPDSTIRVAAEAELMQYTGQDYPQYHGRIFDLEASVLQRPTGTEASPDISSRQSALRSMLTVAPGLVENKREERKNAIRKGDRVEIFLAAPLLSDAQLRERLLEEEERKIDKMPILKAPSLILDGLTAEGNFTGIDMDNTSMRGVKFDGSLFQDNDLNGVDATGGRFRYTTFINVDAKGMTVEGANFDRATLFDVNLQDVDLTEASFTGATVTVSKEMITQEQVNALDAKGANVTIYETLTSTGDSPLEN
jgi:uncharacterized protein YjbI with pentapeptide repeats